MFTEDKKLYVAHCNKGPIYMNGNMANRHGLIAGATGTGKTVTLQVLAETFSQAGVPCLMTDIKGDLSGVSQAGGLNGFISKRCEEFGIQNPEFKGSTVRFFDIFGKFSCVIGPALYSFVFGLTGKDTLLRGRCERNRTRQLCRVLGGTYSPLPYRQGSFLFSDAAKETEEETKP